MSTFFSPNGFLTVQNHFHWLSWCYDGPYLSTHLTLSRLSLQLKREELQWDQLVLLRPLQTLAQTVASLMSGSGPLKEETFWSMLGDEEERLGG